MVDSLSNGIMKNTNDDKENILLDKTKQDKNKEFFSELVNKSPLFKLGFSQDKLFYDENPVRLTRSGTYFNTSTDLNYIKSKIDRQQSSAGKNFYSRIAKRMESNEIPQGDFVYMSGIMKPEDRVHTRFKQKEVQDMGLLSGAVSVRDLLDRTDELGTHLEEFVHRAFRIVPELDEWKKNNITRTKDEEALMGYMVSKYFPDLAKYESERILNVYNVDINNKMNVDILDKWINEIEEISNDILRNKGIKIKPKIKPKPDSIMDKPKIEPKVKPKPDEKEKTWMEIIKSLFN
tara:strand:- start:80 stop:952 length:873 start_codon:yes stop_codon:yes gene_type:complete